MSTVGLAKVKAQLSALLDAVEAGDEVVITRMGQAVARLVRDAQGPQPKAAVPWPQRPNEGLRQLAERNHRSMQEQARMMIMRYARLSRSSPLDAPKQWRERFKGRQFPQLISDLRADRYR